MAQQCSSARQVTILPGYECQPDEDGVRHSNEKLLEARADLTATGDDSNYAIDESVITLEPCTDESETRGYRCKCTFQLVEDGCDGDGTTTRELRYAMRHKGEAVPLGRSSFPIATPRIQQAMSAFLAAINEIDSDRRDESNTSGFKLSLLRRALESVTFASSWPTESRRGGVGGGTGEEGSDCIITLHYSSPLPEEGFPPGCTEETEWKREASEVVSKANLVGICGRSRKRAIHVGDELVVRDTVRVLRQDTSVEVLGMGPPEDCRASVDNAEELLTVRYEKLVTAFCHPNGDAMCKALHWILNKCLAIASEAREEGGGQEPTPLRLLEIYCGCGAHTLAIAKVAAFDEIVAVEIDERLVGACLRNCKLNDCDAAECEVAGVGANRTDLGQPTPVRAFKGDAAEWARNCLRARGDRSTGDSSRPKAWYGLGFHALLVDPPRNGLDENVIDMAMRGEFQHVLYVSCGRRALKRDLKRLAEAFNVVDCTMLDLFPRTNAVESLVHLRRKK